MFPDGGLHKMASTQWNLSQCKVIQREYYSYY